MKASAKLKQRALRLKKEIGAIAYLVQEPGLSLLPKLLMFLTLAYALSPIDLVPDFIPVLGYVDDLFILPALIALTIKTIPNDVMKAARERAEREPPQLKKRWFFAVLFIVIWLSLAGLVFRFLFKA
ncbi:YkvA family protein [Sediminispirochaeta smaragdinae]|uniref:DUF1232 domain-containing protein n=1 Tax=Sediminispirochaeta smaragdinae (strain DSM 11293 / JCM 15392 / SEBR 4228) TaxID=573413 RepID=E1RCU1_SEDSS|nr:protein of unknown function DUF1232 [Sediminispirochaeta smaragdinae DSM 11293]